MTKKAPQEKEPTKKASKLRIPLEFEDAVAAFLNVPPPPKPAKTKAATTKRTTKRH